MATLFISDIHLDLTREEITHQLHHFLAEQAAEAETLYILGDLFEIWIGDDLESNLTRPLISALKQLTSHGTALYFIVGNRDFLMGNRFVDACGGKLLDDPTVIDLYGQRVIMSHGDLLCTRDTSYLRFRHIIRQPWLKRCFLALPIWLRQRIANQLRQRSQYHVRHTPLPIMDVTPDEAIRWLAHHEAQLLIHGHTHRPAIHSLPDNKARIVLPAWEQRPGYLICDSDGQSPLTYQLKWLNNNA